MPCSKKRPASICLPLDQVNQLVGQIKRTRNLLVGYQSRALLADGIATVQVLGIEIHEVQQAQSIVMHGPEQLHVYD